MVSIIIPYIRPEGMDRCVKAIRENAGVSDDQYEIHIAGDHNRIGCPKMVANLVMQTKYEWVMFLADDTEPEKDFLKNALERAKALDGGWGMVGLNDQFHNGNNLATHWMCHKKMLPLLGGEFFHTGYNHLFCDNELIDIARENGRYVWAKDAKITHHHPIVEGKELTGDYAKVYEDKKAAADHKLYLDRKLKRTGVKLGIGFPITDSESRVDTLFFYSFLGLIKPDYILLTPRFSYYPSDIAKARNDLCSAALENGCTHLLMMDTDQVYHAPGMIETLLNHKKPFVGVKVHRRWSSFDPIMFRDGKPVPDDEVDAGGLVEVHRTGGGCVMVETSLLLDILFPWFEMKYDDQGSVVEGEDFNFCRKVREAGKKIYVDCDIKIGHLSKLQVDENLYKLQKKLMR